MSALKLSPVDQNYLTSFLVYQNIIQNFVTPTLASGIAAGDDTPILQADGQGRAWINGSAKINTSSVSANMQLLTLPVPYVPKYNFVFPVAVLRAGALINNAVRLNKGGNVLSSLTVGTPGDYTAKPTASLSGPGYGATLGTITMGAISTTALVAAGATYDPGDVLTVSGGTSSQAAQITVDTVSAGAIATFHISRAGSYTVLPSNPVSVTGGAGTGATFTMHWGVLTVPVTFGGYGYTPASSLVFSAGAAAASLVLGASTTGVLSLVTSPNQNDIVYLDAVRMILNSYN